MAQINSSARNGTRSAGKKTAGQGASGYKRPDTARRRKPASRLQSRTIAKKPARKKYPRQGRMDISFFFLVVVLVTIGLVMVFSASYATSLYENKSGLTLVLKQSVFVAMGLVAMYVLSYIPYQLYFKLYKLIYFGCLLLTAVALLFHDSRGANRWIKFGGFTFQPSELMKFGLIITFAALISINFRQMGTVKKGILPFMMYLMPVLLVIVLQRHVSCILLMLLICGCMMLVAGSRIYYLAALIPLGLLAYPIIRMMGFTYIDTRIAAWQNPFLDIQNGSWQVVQSLYAIGSGGLFGVGLGNSTQKFLWVSEPQNDFIFAIICEELGLIGALAIILLFVLFVASGLSIAMRAPDKFSSMVVIGVVFQFGIQALLNIAVVTNSMPTTGISLPFFSAGGSATLMQLAQIGVVLNISRYCRPSIAKTDTDASGSGDAPKNAPKNALKNAPKEKAPGDTGIRIISSHDI